jgi:hypothetical protein
MVLETLKTALIGTTHMLGYTSDSLGFVADPSETGLTAMVRITNVRQYGPRFVADYEILNVSQKLMALLSGQIQKIGSWKTWVENGSTQRTQDWKAVKNSNFEELPFETNWAKWCLLPE